jgi:predicted alpha/beta-hydrolase family hydrolase
MVDVAGRLAEAGVRTVTFNFPYMESGRRAPDPPAVLEACFRAVVADVRGAIAGETPLFIGGKSLGGRMASHLAANDDPPVAGLVCLGYPLHPPGQPERLRTKHLGGIRVPVLIVQGSRDPFGGPDEIRAHTGVVKGKVTVVPVEKGDHSFKVPKRVATADSVMQAVTLAIVRWMDGVTSAR